MVSFVARVLLVAVLVAVLGWPALATVIAAWSGDSSEGGGFLAATASDIVSGRVARPVDLAVTSSKLVLLAEAIALPIGVALAVLLFRTDLWGRRVLLALLAVAAFVPMPLHATAWIGGFGNAGRMQALGASPVLVGLVGAAFIHAMAALPWIVLLAGVGLRTVEPELEESAALDLPPWRVLTGITVRRSVGALAGAALAVAVLTAGDMTVTDLLQVRSYAEEAYVQFRLGQGPAAAATVAVPPLAVLGAMVVVASAAILTADPARLATIGQTGKPWRLGRWRVPLGLMAAATAGAVLLLPLVTMVWRAGRVGGNAALGQAPRWSAAGLVGTLRAALLDVAGSSVGGSLRQFLQTGTWANVRSEGAWFRNPLASPLIQSMTWGAVGASASVALAWGMAWLSRRPGPWRWVSAACVALALAAPGPVAGMALVLAYRSVPAVYDSPLIVIAAFVLRTFPYALLVLWPAVRALPEAYFETADVEEASRSRQVVRIALPLSRGALIAAWGVSFVLAVGELPASNLVAPPGTELMAGEIWSLLHTGVESHLAGVALVMLAAVAAIGSLVIFALVRLDTSTMLERGERTSVRP